MELKDRSSISVSMNLGICLDFNLVKRGLLI